MAIAIAAGGCALGGPGVRFGRAKYQPVALTILRGPFAPGGRGMMVGYLLKPPVPEPPSAQTKSGRFTYSMDFRLVEVRRARSITAESGINAGGRLGAEGTRRIYFQPDGARCSFADPSSFESANLVETDRVRFSIDLGVQIMVRLVASATDARPFDYDGKIVTPAHGREDSEILFGQPSSQFGGWLMTESG